MLATLATKPFSDPDWLFEIKWDGYRVQAVVARRQGPRCGPATSTTPRPTSRACSRPPTWIEAREAIVDGEVVALDDAGRPDFCLLQERLGDKRGARASSTRPSTCSTSTAARCSTSPLEDRKRLLKSVLRPHPRVRFAAHVEGEGDGVLRGGRGAGPRGHRRQAPPVPLRARPALDAWLKIKIRPEQELVVGGWTPGEGNARTSGALVVGVYEDGKLRFAGKVGSGFTARTRKDAARARSRPLETDDAAVRPAAAAGLSRAAGAATSRASAGSGRSS